MGFRKLFNADAKIISKSLLLAVKLKHGLPQLISSNQTAYVTNRFVSESGILIFDVIKMCDILDIAGYLVTMDKSIWFFRSWFQRNLILVKISYAR